MCRISLRSNGTLGIRLNERGSEGRGDDNFYHFDSVDSRRHSMGFDRLAAFGSDAMVRRSMHCQPNSMDIERDYCRSFRRIDAAMDLDPMASSQPGLGHKMHYFGQSIERMQSNCLKRIVDVSYACLAQRDSQKLTFDGSIDQNQPIVLLSHVEWSQDYLARSTVPMAMDRNCSVAMVVDALAAVAEIHSNWLPKLI